MSRKNEQWFYFHFALKGFICFRKGKIIPKYILFWTGYKSAEIVQGMTDVELYKKPNR